MVLSLVTILAIASGFVVSGLFRGTPASAQAAGNPYSASQGAISAIPRADLTNVKSSPTSSHSDPSAIRVNRPTHSTGAGNGNGAPQAPASPSGNGHSLLQDFNGLSGVDSFNVNGTTVEPPDQGLCVNNDFVLEEVNSVFALYHRNGTLASGLIAMNDFFAEPPAEFTSDPRCYFDPSTHAWFSTMLAIDPNNKHSHLDIEVSTNDNPLKAAVVYQLDTTDKNDRGCPCFGDQPLFGLDQFNFYASTNEFSILGPQFNGAQIYVIDKSALVHMTQANFVHFGNLNIGGAIAASVQPAITNGNANAEYFLNSLDPNGTFDNRLGVWAITGRDKVGKGGVPNLSSIVITSETYGLPPNAQSPHNELVATDDDRMQQVQFINGQLWSSLTTAITIPGDTQIRSAAAWFEVQPQLKGNIIGGATITGQGYVDMLGTYLMYPAIQTSPDGTAVMTMSLSAAQVYPSAVYTVKPAGNAGFGAVKVAAAGVDRVREFACLPKFGGVCRWGDYSAAVIDPSNNGKSIWMATEYIPGPGYTHTNWGTRVMEIEA
ncbi:MAG TPA: hypothetical protein VJ761_09450 [Ktedonobacteraceae bacterium]|nr:hypothetical protein [Ktedonobacteraceae bacterium]